MITFLKYSLSLLLFFMIYIVVSTSLASNLFEEWSFLAAIPWMRATLWDFYANVLIIYLWVVYKEKSIVLLLLWAVLFFCLGSIATLTYVLLQLFRARPGETVREVLVNTKRQRL